MRIFGRITRNLENLGASFGIAALRIAIGIIYLWFGVPKLFPGTSPAESLAAETVEKLTFGIIGGTVASTLTGALEALIGILLISKKYLSLTSVMLLGHMVGTFTPLFIFPGKTWETFCVGTLEGQYILKNLVIVAAAMAIIGHSNPRIGTRGTPPLNRAENTAPGTRPPAVQVPDHRPVRLHTAKKARHDDHVPAPRS
ncbi:DoxX family protein [Streptomyces sp. NPDC002814]